MHLFNSLYYEIDDYGNILILTYAQVSATCTKIELVYSGITERTWTNTIIIYFNWIFTKNFTMNVNFVWYFLYVQYLSHIITLSH